MLPLRNYLIATFVLLGLLSLYIPQRYDLPYPKAIGPELDKRVRTTYIDILNTQQPVYFLLGDSMPGDAIDITALNAGLGQKAELASLIGTASTIWYLIIKNNLVEADFKPKYLVIFLRDTMMTTPGYRVTGRYFEQVDEFASPEDTLLIERAYISQMSLLERWAEAYLPLYGSRWTVRESLEYHLRYPIPEALLHCDQACMEQALYTVFQQNNLDQQFLSEAIDAADDFLYSPASLDFDSQVERSFLPEIIRLTRENDIQLVLVRMPILRFSTPALQPRGLDTYIRKLSAYLAQNNVPFLDFDQKTIPAAYYKDAIHLNEQGREFFTRELVKALKALAH